MGSSTRPSSSVQTQVRQEYPAFFQPHLEKVLGGAEAQFDRDYEPFPLARLVETPESRTAALTALQGDDLARMSQPVYTQALAETAEAGKTFPELDLQSYMNPYQQLVTDQLLRKATERRGVDRKKISDAAVRAGAFGGSRHGVAEGMFDEATQEQLQDIQDRSDMANFSNALAAAQADQQRGLASAQQLAGLGQAQQQALTTGLVGQEKAATADQALKQQIRDVGFQEFMEQRDFPQQKLAEYSAIIRGHTPPTNMWQTRDIQQAYSPLQQGVGTVGMLGGLAKGLGGGSLFGKTGGVVPFSKGGGISSLPFAHGDIIPDTPDTEDIVSSAINQLMDVGKGKRPEEATASSSELPSSIYESLAETLRDTAEAPRLARDMGESRAGRFPTTEIADLGEDWTLGESWQRDKREAMLGQGFEDPPRYQPKNFAYGGVPGQAYTEDIGTVGGLGAIAGPQMRFAYGGVPGQPYTEDIGMVGGLAAIAGPQMRFQSGQSVPKYSPYSAQMYGDIYGESTLYPPTVDDRGLRVPSSNIAGLIGEKYRQLFNPKSVRGLGVKQYPWSEPIPIDETNMSDKAKEVARAAHYAVNKDAADRKRAKEVSRLLNPELYEDEEEEVITEEVTTGPDTFGEETSEIFLGDLAPKEKPKEEPKAKPKLDDKEKVTEKATTGMGYKEMLAYFTPLMTGSEAGAIAAGRNIAAVKGADTPLDKALKESLIDARKATTASQKSKAKNDLLKMLFTQRRDSDKFRLEMAKFVNTIQNQSDEMALKTWEGLDPASKMAAMGLIGEEEEVEELMKDPDKYIQAIRSAISKFASTNRPSTATTQSQLEAATGGSIPNTLAKAGISSIRRI